MRAFFFSKRACIIVHLEILVVQVVGIGVGVEAGIRSGLDLVEADMADDRPGSRDLGVVDQQQGMRRQDQVDQAVGPVEEVLDGVHRQAGPGRRVDRVVVNRMHPFVEQRRMDQAVDREEMHLMDRRGQQHDRRKIPRIVRPAQPRHIARGEGMQEQHLDQRPERDGDEEGPQEVVDILRLEPEHVRRLL